MVSTRNISPTKGDTILMVGTLKGAFLFRSDADRKTWEMGGPYWAGHTVYAMAYDKRGSRNRIWASPSSMHWGASLSSTDDFGENWTNAEETPVKFPEGTDTSLKQIWQIECGNESEPDVMYCGVEPA